MSQSRAGSAAEAVTNVVAGAAINFVLQLLLFPLLGWAPSIHVNVVITLTFTVFSLLRSYIIRRLFDGGISWQTEN